MKTIYSNLVYLGSVFVQLSTFLFGVTMKLDQVDCHINIYSFVIKMFSFSYLLSNIDLYESES